MIVALSVCSDANAQGQIEIRASANAGPIRGIVRSLDQAAISTELAVRLATVHVREGEAFKAGTKLLEFDCRRHRAGVAAAEALQLEMQLNVDKFRVLQRTQAVGKNDLEVAEARLVKAAAEADGLRSQLDQCVVVAPFDGRVLELSLQKFETAQPGKPFIAIVSSTKLEIDLVVPSDWIRWVKPGITFAFSVDEIQRPLQAVVVRTAAAVEPVSQTIKISATFADDTRDVLPGMSGTAVFQSLKSGQ
jgi:membrane fusion protein, multidrug efflux system